jgi:N-methylhydantoinase A
MLRIAIDIGGTFTDLIAASDEGDVYEAKVPSDREHPERALEEGLGELAGRTEHRDVASLLGQTRIVIQGTTVAINAVLQGKGVKTGLLCTRGFRDTLEIRLGYKEERYVFPYEPPPVLVPRPLRLPISERIDKNGNVRTALAEREVEEAADALRAAGVEAVAICFLWSFLNPEHEQQAEAILKERLPGVFVTSSADVLPRIREYNRTSTTVLNAYVGPIVERYVTQTEQILRNLGFAGRIRYVQSNGGLAEAKEVTQRPVLLLVSGPAAAPAAGLRFAPLAGRDFITIDMGGTSFDTCLVRDGLPDMRGFTDVNRYRVATPLIDVHTIGSGGGSIAAVHAGLLRVGPESAEAHPGPACYMRGGTRPTVTDANVVSGLLNPRELLGGRFPIDASLARTAIEEGVAGPAGMSVEDAAAGIVEVVSRDMADAIREITVRRGHDPRDYSLVVGGGAGGLHAAHLADELGISKVVVPRVASEFCAFGAVVADVRHDYTRSFVADTRHLDFGIVAGIFEGLEGEGRRALRDEGVGEDGITFLRALDLRYKDQVWEVTIDASDVDLVGGEARDAVEARFHRRHEELYDFSQPGYPCELISLTLTAIGRSPGLSFRAANASGTGSAPEPVGRRPARFRLGEPAVEAPVYAGEDFLPGHSVEGPAIVEEPNTTIAVPPGWRAAFHGTEQAYVVEAHPRDG